MIRFVGMFLLLACALSSAAAQDRAGPPGALSGLDVLQQSLLPGRVLAPLAPAAAGADGAAAGDVLSGDEVEKIASEREKRVSSVIEVALIITLLSLAPTILLSVTSFTRIVIVLSFVRRALALQEMPPNQIVIGLALFLTLMVMFPVFSDIHDQAIEPYMDGKLHLAEAGDRAAVVLKTFLLGNTRSKDIQLFAKVAGIESLDKPEDTPLRVVVPAFVLSELKTAFQMGFMIFLPFLIIDLVVAAILLSMGMFMLPPIVISTPFKIMLFVLVDGWNLVISSLVHSIVV